MVLDAYPEARGLGAAADQGKIQAGKVQPATFLTGLCVENAFSATGRPSPVEDLNARAFGTLSAQPRASQSVSGSGRWNKRIWRVVFRRSLKTQDRWDVDFSAAKTVRVALAVWDGAAGDRNGQKAVSIWHNLELTQGGER